MVVSIHGEQDASTVVALAGTLALAIAVDEADLVLDLSDVGFLDSAAAGVILRARDFLSERSRHLVVRAPSSSAWRALDSCGAAGIIEPCLTAASAPAPGSS